MGLDVYLEEYEDTEDLPINKTQGSTEQPELLDQSHLFRNDYLRSSYNSGGFNSVVDGILNKGGLWYIFEPCGDLESGRVTPSDAQLQLARKRAEEIHQQLQDADPTYSTFVAFNTWKDDDETYVSDTHSAVEKFHETMENHAAGPFGNASFQNGDGKFYPQGLNIKAAIIGFGTLAQKGVWLIHDIDLDWYIEAARRTIVFIDTALSMDNPKISWSY